MKKFKIIGTFLIIGILLTGCNAGVSQNKYDNLQAKYDILKVDYDTMKVDYDKSKDDLSDLKALCSDLSKEKVDSAINSINTDDIVIEAWGTTAFGDKTILSRIDSNTVQYTASIDNAKSGGVSKFFSKYKKYASLLKSAMDTNDTQYVYIKAVDTGLNPICELFIDLSSGTENATTDIMTNSSYNDIIEAVISKLTR